MSNRESIKRNLAIGLSAILICLSFLASLHDVRHIDDAANNHCTLCFHAHHYNKYLPQAALTTPQLKQVYLPFEYIDFVYFAVPRRFFNSRAPPLTY